MLLSRPVTCHACPQKNLTTSLPIRPLEPVTSNFFAIPILEKQIVRRSSSAWPDLEHYVGRDLKKPSHVGFSHPV
jgi:hypothetical protein